MLNNTVWHGVDRRPSESHSGIDAEIADEQPQ